MGNTRMKVFATKDPFGVTTGAGGYIIGDGELPPDFNPDEFMKRFSSKIIAGVIQGNGEAMMVVQQEIDKAIAEAVVKNDRAIDEAACVAIPDTVPVMKLLDRMPELP